MPEHLLNNQKSFKLMGLGEISGIVIDCRYLAIAA